MGILRQIFVSVVVLSMFMTGVAFPGEQQQDDGSTASSVDLTTDWENVGLKPGGSPASYPNSDPNCEQMQLSVAVLPWPPYAGSDSHGWQSKILNELRLISHLKNVTFRKVPNKRELQNLIKANKTDIAFPLIRRYHVNLDYDLVLENHPGLDFLVAPKTQSPGKVCIDTLLDSWPLLALTIILTGMAGILIWLLERIGNREEFPRTFARGSWEGFWWAFISMTTVGYGDKSPRSIAGRCFAVIWIFVGLIIVAIFMANVTTALTSISVKPEYKISDGEVGVVSGSLEETIARNKNAEVKGFENYDKLTTAFRKREVWRIIIDRYTAIQHLQNESAEFRQQIFRSEHFTLADYRIVANISESKIGDNHVYCVLDDIKKAVKRYLARQQIKSIQGIKNGSSATTYSFNLFTHSKKDLQYATYIALAVLGGLIFVGLVLDIIFWKAKSTKVEEHELEVTEEQEIMQGIAKGKELLKELQLIHQNLEQKIMNSNYAWKKKTPEKFSSIYSQDIVS